MQNAWNVQFEEEGVLKIKVFEGDKPKDSGAVDFAKKLKLRGLKVDVISRRRAYAPPVGKEPSGYGLLWCPYCIKWREFEVAAVVHPTYETPELLRCTVCTISVMDYYVRKYNPVFVERHTIREEMNKTRVPTKPVLRRRRR
jgi:hypothetical protein